MCHTDHDRRVTQSKPRRFVGARERFLARTARHVLANAEHGVEIDDEWVDTQLALVGATRPEYESVLSTLEAFPGANTPSDSTADLSTEEIEDAVLAALNAERSAAARTTALLADLEERSDADWSSLAALAAIPVDALRSRAGRNPAATGYVTVTEAARLLGVARSTLHRQIRDGKARVVDVGGRHRFALDENGLPIV